MKLICPSCGAVHSAEAWENDAAARDALAALAGISEKVRPYVLPYLAYFRKPGHGLVWRRASRILADLLELMGAPEIAWKGNARPVTWGHWAEGLQVVAGKTDLARPLENHNYLRHVVYGLADRDAAKKEAQEEEKKRPGYRPLDDGENAQGEPRMSAAEYKKRHGIDRLGERVGP